MTKRRLSAVAVAVTTATSLAIAPAQAQDLSSETMGSIDKGIDEIADVSTSSESTWAIQNSTKDLFFDIADLLAFDKTAGSVNGPLFGENADEATALSAKTIGLGALLMPFAVIAAAIAAAVAAAANFAGQR